MRIGLISFEMTASGGEQRQVLCLANELQEMGHGVTLYAYRYNPTHCYPALTRQLDIRAIETVTEDRLAQRSDTLGVLSVAARRYFLESRVLAQRVCAVDVMNPHGRPAHRTAVFVKRKTGTPVVWTSNDVVGWEKTGHRQRVPSRVHSLASHLMKPREQRTVRDIDAIAVLDHNVRDILLGTYGRPTRVVPSGVDTQALAERPEGRRRIRGSYRIANEVFLVLWLGILEPFRRIEDLLEAVRLLRQQRIEVRVLVVGRHDAAPHYAERLARMVTEYRLEPLVRFVAHSVPEEELADYYSACDALVFPNDEQAWGLAPLEALACRRPVIVSRGSGVHEVLVDGETALLVPPREPEPLASALRRLVADPALAERIACQGREFVVRELSWKNYAARMAELFVEAFAAAARRPARALAAHPHRDEWATQIIAASEPLWRVR